MKTHYQAFEEQSPELLLKMRNTIVERGISILLEDFDEIMVFYGAMHMIGIETFLINNDFVFKNEIQFEVFSIEDKN